MSIMAERRARTNTRGRSAVAERLHSDRIANGLTPEDIGERRHAYYHAQWSASGIDYLRPLDQCARPSVCDDIREGGERLVRRVEKLGAATHAAQPRKYAEDIYMLDFLVNVAHAEASMDDVFAACIVETIEQRKRMVDHARSQTKAQAQSIVSRILAGDVKYFESLGMTCMDDFVYRDLAEHFRDPDKTVRRRPEVDERLRELDA